MPTTTPRFAALLCFGLLALHVLAVVALYALGLAP